MFNLFCNKKSNHVCIKIFNENCIPVCGVVIFLKNLRTNKFYSFITNKKGCILIRNIPNCKYELTTYKKKYKSKKIIIDTNIKNTFCIKLKKFKTSIIEGYITNASNNKVIGATVVLYLVLSDNMYSPVQFTRSNLIGFYKFKNVPMCKIKYWKVLK